MHRKETMVLFTEEEQRWRKSLWRSLFILDRILATYLGRPVAIAEEEYCEDLLDPPIALQQHSPQAGSDEISSMGHQATVRSAHVIGLILRKVYLQRRVSTRLAQSLADECKKWPENLPPTLHWRRATSSNRRQATAILYSNLAYCHSIVLLSRPFFLHVLSCDVHKVWLGNESQAPRNQGRMQKFSDACIIASTHAVALVQNAYEGRYLPRLNSIATYSLFNASLIIFANEFAHPSANTLLNQCMDNAISIISFCGKTDPQAKRATQVLEEFREVIQKRKHQLGFQLQPPVMQTTFDNATPSQNDKSVVMPELGSNITPVPPLPDVGFTPEVDLTATGMNNQPSTIIDRPLVPNQDAFSGFLDLTNTVLPNYSDTDWSSSDEAIDFDGLLAAWPDGASLDFGVLENATDQNTTTGAKDETFNSAVPFEQS